MCGGGCICILVKLKQGMVYTRKVSPHCLRKINHSQNAFKLDIDSLFCARDLRFDTVLLR